MSVFEFGYTLFFNHLWASIPLCQYPNLVTYALELFQLPTGFHPFMSRFGKGYMSLN